MRETMTKYILFHLEDKEFYEGGGECCDKMSGAYTFPSRKEAESFKDNNLDYPSKFEVWEIYIVFQTKTKLQDMFE